MSAFVIFLVLLAIMAAGVPIAFALGGLGALLLWLGDFSPLMTPQGLLSAIDNFILLAVPLFLLMSNVLLKGGVGRDLFAAVQSWVGHWPGGLAVATIASCALFASISGVSVATAATIGTVAIPEMINRGYDRRFVLGLLAAGGTLGILIPPSIPLILFGDIAEQSISDLFLAGIGPGILLALLFIVYALIRTRADGTVVIERASWKDRRDLSLRALPTIALAALIFTGLYAGAFTPTEAAGIGFTLSIVLTALVLRTLTWVRFKEAVMEAMQTTVNIFLIIAGAKIFARAITLYRIPQDLSLAITSNISDAGLFVFVVSFVLLLLGFFMDPISLLLILVPLLLPALATLGIDPIWFGILFVVLIECALITPPVGLNLFVIQATSKASLVEITQGVWPFVVLMLFAIFVMFWLPDIVLYVPFKL